MTPTTSFDRDAITRSATAISGLLDSHRAALLLSTDPWPGLGDFPAARALDQTVTARRAAVAEHVTRVESALHDMGSALRAIADDLTETDQSNAAVVGELDTMTTHVAEALAGGAPPAP